MGLSPLWAHLAVHMRLKRGKGLLTSHAGQCRVQAALGNFLATVIPRARIVPAVRGEDMSADQATVRFKAGCLAPWAVFGGAMCVKAVT